MLCLRSIQQYSEIGPGPGPTVAFSHIEVNFDIYDDHHISVLHRHTDNGSATKAQFRYHNGSMDLDYSTPDMWTDTCDVIIWSEGSHWRAFKKMRLYTSAGSDLRISIAPALGTGCTSWDLAASCVTQNADLGVQYSEFTRKNDWYWELDLHSSSSYGSGFFYDNDSPDFILQIKAADGSCPISSSKFFYLSGLTVVKQPYVIESFADNFNMGDVPSVCTFSQSSRPKNGNSAITDIMRC